ncbi:tubulin binding cofactor C-domain-containing protein [Coemansia spiralis]|nr:tubulin binding cofactor C-domain-containing protein [Coemansia spiralis]
MASAGSQANAAAASQFWEYFQQQKTQIEQTADVQMIRDLDTALREALVYLPAYDQKQLAKEMESLRQLAKPSKQGFRFKSAKPKPADIISKETPTMPQTNTPVVQVSGKWVAPSLQADCELRDISHSIVDLRPSGSIRALNCHRLHNTIVIAAFDGSLTMRDSTNVLLIASVRQMRVENSTDISIHLYCSSRPVIEGSRGIQFAQCPAEMHRELPNLFDRVDDFNWLKRQQSPNWSIGVPLGDEFWSLINGPTKPHEALLRFLPLNKD